MHHLSFVGISCLYNLTYAAEKKVSISKMFIWLSDSELYFLAAWSSLLMGDPVKAGQSSSSPTLPSYRIEQEIQSQQGGDFFLGCKGTLSRAQAPAVQDYKLILYQGV